MTFPSVASVTRSNDNTSQTTHSVTLPATINAGDILLAMYAHSGSSAITWDNSTAGSWSSLFDQAGSTLVRSTAFWKTADGTEDGLSLSVLAASASRAIWHIYRITGGQSVECGTAVDSGGNTNAPDAPSLSPSWGSDDTLWLCNVGHNSTFVTATGPTDYTTNAISDTTPTSGVSMHSSYRTNAASSEDPGAWALGTNRRCVSQTFAIRPAGGASYSGEGDASASGAASGVALANRPGVGAANASAIAIGAMLAQRPVIGNAFGAGLALGEAGVIGASAASGEAYIFRRRRRGR